MSSLQSLCFDSVKKNYLEKKIKLESFQNLPENLVEQVCKFLPSSQQIRVFGVCCRWYGGVLREKSFYNKGKLEGQLLKWDDQGRVLEETVYKSGLKHGRRVVYSPSKNLIYCIKNYKSGRLHGKCTYYRDTGDIWKTANYKNGVLAGRKEVWFPLAEHEKDQKLSKVKKYCNGEKEGHCTWYFQDGKVRKRELWVKGILVS